MLLTAPVIVLVALIGPLVGTRLWTTLMIVLAPLVTLALYLAQPETIWSYVAGFVLAPLAAIAGILAVCLPRRR